MTFVERLSTATTFLVAAYTIGATLFFLARELALRFMKRFEGDAVPKYWLVIVLSYPAAVVYAFAVHALAGFVVALPAVAILVVPELFIANWTAEPSVKFPESVPLTNPLRKVNGKFETRVNIDGEDWSAEFTDDGLAPPSRGEIVRVVERRGLKLIIARVEHG